MSSNDALSQGIKDFEISNVQLLFHNTMFHPNTKDKSWTYSLISERFLAFVCFLLFNGEFRIIIQSQHINWEIISITNCNLLLKITFWFSYANGGKLNFLKVMDY